VAHPPANVTIRSTLAPDHPGYSIADAEMLRALSEAEDRHFWHTTRNEYIANGLLRLGLRPPSRVLDVGCGGGCVTAHLARLGYVVTGVEGHLARVLEAAARAPSARFVVQALGSDGSLDRLGPFDVACLFDVIEHLDDPRAAVEEAARAVRPGGYLVGTVPALRCLWSNADERAGHRLRYDRARLVHLMQGIQGLQVQEILDFNRLLVPMLWLQRRVLIRNSAAAQGGVYLRVPWQPVNRILGACLRWEHRWAGSLPGFRAIPGSSLWFALKVVGGLPEAGRGP
jgi:2-polyprenyl-3-methyl-5-hydroxy-6-metoxy-1,4-benzoquinol methylase